MIKIRLVTEVNVLGRWRGKYRIRVGKVVRSSLDVYRLDVSELVKVVGVVLIW